MALQPGQQFVRLVFATEEDVGLVSRLPISSTDSIFDETKADTGSVMAYGENFRGGVNLGTGPVNGMNGGFAALLTAPAEGRTALVKAFAVTDTSDAHQHGEAPGFPIITELASFQAYESRMHAGTSVGAVSTPTGADLVTTPATRAFPRVRRFTYRPEDRNFSLTAEFRAFSADTRGATIAAK